jgi:hypothetical protein
MYSSLSRSEQTESIMARLFLGLVLVLWIISGVRLARAEDRPVLPPAAPQVLVMLRMAPQHFRPDAGYGGSYGDGEGRSARWRVARRLAEREGVSLVQEWPMPVLGISCYVMSVPPGRSAEQLAVRFSQEPEVSWSQPVHLYRAQAAAPDFAHQAMSHDDPLYPLQPAAREWRLAALHVVATGRDVHVAVIDSQIDTTQPDLVGQIDTAQDFVGSQSAPPEEHGTAVAGVIAAKADNGVGIAGVAPQAKLLALRACWQDGAKVASTFCDSLSLAKALDYAIGHDADIINMSLSGPDDRLLEKLIDVALSRRIVVVAACDPAVTGCGFPASRHGVVAVEAEGGMSFRPGTLSAPGRDVPTTLPGDRWGMENGSSFAAAHVSGLFALLKEHSRRTEKPASIVIDRKGGIDACATLLQDSLVHEGNCGPGGATFAMVGGSHQNGAGP